MFFSYLYFFVSLMIGNIKWNKCAKERWQVLFHYIDMV